MGFRSDFELTEKERNRQIKRLTQLLRFEQNPRKGRSCRKNWTSTRVQVLRFAGCSAQLERICSNEKIATRNHFEWQILEESMNKTDNDYLKECLGKLLEDRMLSEDTEIGVAKIVISSGTENLSLKQKAVFENYILKRYLNRICSNCGEEIPWCEMPTLMYDSERKCGKCIHNLEKND